MRQFVEHHGGNINILEKDLSKFNGQELLSGLGYLVSTERKITYHILRFILEIDSRRLYLDAGYDSVYSLLRDKFKYSERSALRRINAAKLLKRNPEISEKIQEGTINLSQLDRVQQCFKQQAKSGSIVTAEKAGQILNQVEGLTTFETERVLATELNFTPQIYDKTRPQSDNTVRMEVTFTQDQFDTLKKAQSLASHVVIETSYAELFNYLAEKFIATMEGKTRASEFKAESGRPCAESTRSAGASPMLETAATTDSEVESLATKHSTLNRRRKYIRRSTRHKLLAEAKHCCSYVHPETQRRCSSNYQLQVDHIVPLSKGGTEDLDNLRILCGKHNRSEAQRWGLARSDFNNFAYFS